MNAASEARLQEVMPELAAKVRQMAEILAGEGIDVEVIQGLRTWQQQDALYAEGRTAPGKVVTNAPGGHSYHNFGLAVDCAPGKNKPEAPFDPDWNAEHPDWKRMEAVGTNLGLESGANWVRLVDAPHFQLTGNFPVGAPTDELREIFRNGGNQAVWEAVRKSST